MATKPTPTDPDALLSLAQRVKENYQEPPPAPPKRGKKRDFSALSFLLLAAIAVTLRTFNNSELRPDFVQIPLGFRVHQVLSSHV